VNLRQLRYFVTIVDEGSVTRAAERLYVAQPSVSQQIKALEAELGGPLLERIPSGVRLTEAGKAFLGDARAALRYSDRAADSARSVLGLHSGGGICRTPRRRWAPRDVAARQRRAR
jgi:DNA-binding transcriptional LysR family regulator